MNQIAIAEIRAWTAYYVPGTGELSGFKELVAVLGDVPEGVKYQLEMQLDVEYGEGVWTTIESMSLYDISPVDPF